MKKYIAYLAVSNDDFVATNEGSVSFLDNYNKDKAIQDDYFNFYKNIDVVISGSNTYEQYMKNINPYEDKKVFILSSRNHDDNRFKFFNGDLNDLDKEIPSDSVVWVMGGANVIEEYIQSGLLDELIVVKVNEDLKSGIKLSLPKVYKSMAEEKLSNIKRIKFQFK